MLKRTLTVGSLALALAVTSLALGAPRAQAADGWAYDLMNELMSPYCPGRPLADCPSPQAQTLRMWLIVQESAGRSRDEVEAEMVARYGESILGAPKAQGIGLTAYVLPALAFLAGGVIWFAFLRRQTRATPASSPQPATAAPLDPELERLVDERLAGR